MSLQIFLLWLLDILLFIMFFSLLVLIKNLDIRLKLIREIIQQLNKNQEINYQILSKKLKIK